ncbi:unnamed protein product [Soboliphyme baturini]|uniref:E3 ubiquitin-protein ligase UBR4-like domain-containing protein n=1 Tax=Soboliphyme baturini TaxID=241478 RepID=A0A3P8DLI4_9BILA|nr:unnamed protein product [Soboliphyme baturini]
MYRSINYNEKDPFLCNSCGFCKYAKFDYTIHGRHVAGVEPLENEEDRRKALSHINSLLEKADNIYQQIRAYRPRIENALTKIYGQDIKTEAEPLNKTFTGSGNLMVNSDIKIMALLYNSDCSAAFEELSKIVQSRYSNLVEEAADSNIFPVYLALHELDTANESRCAN